MVNNDGPQSHTDGAIQDKAREVYMACLYGVLDLLSGGGTTGQSWSPDRMQALAAAATAAELCIVPEHDGDEDE